MAQSSYLSSNDENSRIKSTVKSDFKFRNLLTLQFKNNSVDTRIFTPVCKKWQVGTRGIFLWFFKFNWIYNKDQKLNRRLLFAKLIPDQERTKRASRKYFRFFQNFQTHYLNINKILTGLRQEINGHAQFVNFPFFVEL